MTMLVLMNCFSSFAPHCFFPAEKFEANMYESIKFAFNLMYQVKSYLLSDSSVFFIHIWQELKREKELKKGEILPCIGGENRNRIRMSSMGAIQ